MISRTNYANADSLDASRFIYPSGPSASNYFVPVAMKIVQSQPQDGFPAANTWVVVTGYGPAASYGTTDIWTVAFNGALTFRWDHTFSKVLDDAYSSPDEYAVDLDVSPGNIAVTGNVWTGSDWNIESVFYSLNGKQLGAYEQGSSGDDFAAGVRINHAQGGSSPGSYTEALVTGTQANSSSGTDVVGYRYYQGGTFDWFADTGSSGTRILTVSGAGFKANTMTSYRPNSSAPGVAVIGGKVTGIDTADMLMVKFDFDNNSHSWSLSFDAPAHGFDEAFAVATDQSYFALGGRGYRGSTFGSDALVTLYKENSSGVPELQWSAWMNGTGATGTVTKTCTVLAIDQDDTVSGRRLIYAAGQTPNGSNVDWRIGVFHSGAVTSPDDPTDPNIKQFFGTPLSVTGSGGGNDAPVHIEFSPASSPYLHMFLVTGNIYNGSTAGDDVTVRKFRFEPPQ